MPCQAGASFSVTLHFCLGESKECGHLVQISKAGRGGKSELVKLDIGWRGLVPAELWSKARMTCSISFFGGNTGSGKPLSPKNQATLFYWTPPLPLSRPLGKIFKRAQHPAPGPDDHEISAPREEPKEMARVSEELSMLNAVLF